MEWQPIETAPKDGTEVILFADGCVEIGVWIERYKSWNPGEWWIEGGEITCKPTHWMPLPAPPTLEDV